MECLAFVTHSLALAYLTNDLSSVNHKMAYKFIRFQSNLSFFVFAFQLDGVFNERIVYGAFHFMLKASNGDLRYACHFSFWFSSPVIPCGLLLLLDEYFNKQKPSPDDRSSTSKHMCRQYYSRCSMHICGDIKNRHTHNNDNQFSIESIQVRVAHSTKKSFNIYLCFIALLLGYHKNNGAYLSAALKYEISTELETPMVGCRDH